MQRTSTAAWCGAALIACLAADKVAQALPGICGGCFGGPPPTLSQQLSEADGAFLARIVSKAEVVVKDAEEEYTVHLTTFELIETLKPGLADVSPRMHVTLDYEHDGSPGELAVLFGSFLEVDEDSESMEENSGELALNISEHRPSQPLFANAPSEPELTWEATGTLTWAGYDYFRRLPPGDWETDHAPASERLAHFVPFLEHPDAIVAEDAYEELDRAAFADLIPLASRLPREKLAKWVTNAEDAGLFRRRLYGILLGLCGNRADAELLRRIALSVPSDDDEDGVELIGIEGAMIGYLMLSGERGLNDLTKNVLASQVSDPESVMRVLLAVQFLASDSPSTIPVGKLQATVRRALDRQDAAASAIQYLNMLADWESQDRIIALFDACGYEDEQIRHAIVGYLQTSAANLADPELRAIAAKAETALADLKRRDPQLFDDAGGITAINY